MTPDNRKTVGGSISALASHVTHLFECHQHYGKNSKKKILNGIVLSVEKSRTKTSRSSTYIDAEFDFVKQNKEESSFIHIVT